MGGRGPRRKPKAWGGRERWWLVGVAGVVDLSSWCGASPVQSVVVSNLLQCVGLGVAAGGWVRLRIAVGGRRRCVRWQQWLKVAEAEGVGPVGGGRSVRRRRRGRRKRFWGEKINASDFSFNSSDFSFIYLFFLKSITMVHITMIESCFLGFYGQIWEFYCIIAFP
jgi:hypothetical protein